MHAPYAPQMSPGRAKKGTMVIAVTVRLLVPCSDMGDRSASAFQPYSHDASTPGQQHEGEDESSHNDAVSNICRCTCLPAQLLRSTCTLCLSPSVQTPFERWENATVLGGGGGQGGSGESGSPEHIPQVVGHVQSISAAALMRL